MKINFTKLNTTAKESKSNKNINSKNNILVEVELLTSEFLKKTSDKKLKTLEKDFDFQAKFSQMQFFENTLYVGLGAEKKLDDLAFQKLGARILTMINGLKYRNAQINFTEKNHSQNASQMGFGMILQGYRFNKYFVDKKKDKEIKINEINFVVSDEKSSQKQFNELQILAQNIFFVRDLVSEPANVLNPESYAEICKSLKKDGLEVEVLSVEQMKKLGMNALLGVGQGSDKKSQLVIMRHNGGKKDQKPLAFVGKGVTFDTGGISIKPSANMEDMKTDMAGSAVVVGLMRHLAQRKAKINVVGVVGLVENMPSGTAQRPGDVVKSMSGQTIEVINTDAEGRLVLADALHYTNTKYQPQFIVDLATLTGAIMVSFADVYAGLFCNDDKLANDLIDCGKQTGDWVWRLPIGEEYDEMINSDIADMKNVGSGRGAGSITAAQFLKRFVGETKWAHLDIAGVAWKGKGDAMAHKGATGFGLRLLDQLVRKFEK